MKEREKKSFVSRSARHETWVRESSRNNSGIPYLVKLKEEEEEEEEEEEKKKKKKKKKNKREREDKTDGQTDKQTGRHRGIAFW